MKIIVVVAMTFFGLGTIATNAQSTYKTSVGLALDFGTGTTLVGPSGKYFFAYKQAVLAEVVFGSGITGVTALYAYHDPISGEDDLKWFIGGGPSFTFIDGGTSFSVRPTIGFDYKVKTMPLNFSFDWRPDILISDGDGFEAARFGIGARYVID
tara:strand:+ start:167 stop:628 length:462 start_codon:yes stop_codon:yes gene_type:complete